MPNISKQYLNFLGGEVSPRLHHRADLEAVRQMVCGSQKLTVLRNWVFLQ